LKQVLFRPSQARLPFEMQRGRIVDLSPEAEVAGIRKGDIFIGIGGHAIDEDETMAAELSKFHPGETIIVNVDRTDDHGTKTRQDISVTIVPLSITFGQIFREFVTTFLFLLCLPGLSFLLGFYVALVRPNDPIAWLLLFMLLGIGSLGIEGSREGTLIRA